MSKTTPRYTAWMQTWFIDSGGDVRLDPDTGKVFQGKVIIEEDDLIEMIGQMGYVVTLNGNNIAGGSK